MEKLQSGIEESITKFLSVNKFEISDSTMKHLVKVCIYFDEIEKKLLYFKKLRNARTITNISKFVKISRVLIYRNEIISAYISYRDEILSNVIYRLDISDRSIELEKEIDMLNIRDASMENLTFEIDNLRQENIYLKREIDRVKKQLSHKKS